MMRRISLSLLAATAMGLIASQAALAADLGHPAYKAPPPAPPPVQDWSGIYVGLEAGYGWGKQNSNAFDPFFFSKFGQTSFFPCTLKGCGPDASISGVDQSGWLFGGFVGAQKQWGSWVLGIEADFDAADIKGSTTARATIINTSLGDSTLTISQTHTLNAKIDELGTVRGKVGWAWSPNWMIYGTGGLAFAHVQDNFSATQDICFDSGEGCHGPPSFQFDELSSNTVSGDGGTTMLGWTVGAGLDWKWQIDQGSAWVLGIEYLHYQFPEHTLTFGGPVAGTGNSSTVTFAMANMQQSIDVVKARISYLFSIH